MRKIDEINIDEHSIIKEGYGEYIVYQTKNQGERFISEEMFNKAFVIINRFSALACVKNNSPEQ